MSENKVPLILGFVVLFLGAFVFNFFRLYDAIPHVDKLFHFLGGLAIAWYISLSWKKELVLLPKLHRFVFLVSAAVLVGFVWEALEFSTTLPRLSFLYPYFHGGNLPDTLGDLWADLAGAAFFALL